MVKKKDTDEDGLLALAFKDVKPLPGRSIKKRSAVRENLYQPIDPPKPPTPRIAKKKNTTHPVLTHKTTPGLDRRSAMRMKRGKIRIEGRLDLHGYSQETARQALVKFINEAFGSGKRFVLVVTGKWLHTKNIERKGVLQKMVPIWLNEAPTRNQIISFSYAIQSDGGEGALYVLLKRHRLNR